MSEKSKQKEKEIKKANKKIKVIKNWGNTKIKDDQISRQTQDR